MAARVMVCGAGDTASFRGKAIATLKGIGIDAFDYTSASASPLSDQLADNIESSRAGISRADLAIFIINGQYGQITWQHELFLAIQRDIPFLMFLNDSTYLIYESIRDGHYSLEGVTNDGMKQLMGALVSHSRDNNRRLFAFKDDFERVFCDSVGGTFEQLLQDRQNVKRLRQRIYNDTEQLTQSRTLLANQHAALEEAQTEIGALRAHNHKLAEELVRPRGSRPNGQWRALISESRVQLLIGAFCLLTMTLGFLIGQNFYRASSQTAPQPKLPPSFAATVSSSEDGASGTGSLQEGLSCEARGWVTYYGLTEGANASTKAMRIRSAIVSLEAWDASTAINISSGESMCSTGFAIAYAEVPAGHVVLWSRPLATRKEAEALCSRLAGSGHGCFVAPNPRNVEARR